MSDLARVSVTVSEAGGKLRFSLGVAANVPFDGSDDLVTIIDTPPLAIPLPDLPGVVGDAVDFATGLAKRLAG